MLKHRKKINMFIYFHDPFFTRVKYKTIKVNCHYMHCILQIRIDMFNTSLFLGIYLKVLKNINKL